MAMCCLLSFSKKKNAVTDEFAENERHGCYEELLRAV